MADPKNPQNVGKSGACTRLMILTQFIEKLGLEEGLEGQEIALETTAGGYRYQKYKPPKPNTPNRFVKKVHVIPHKKYLFFYHSNLNLGDTYNAVYKELEGDGWVYLNKE